MYWLLRMCRSSGLFSSCILGDLGLGLSLGLTKHCSGIEWSESFSFVAWTSQHPSLCAPSLWQSAELLRQQSLRTNTPVVSWLYSYMISLELFIKIVLSIVILVALIKRVFTVQYYWWSLRDSFRQISLGIHLETRH